MSTVSQNPANPVAAAAALSVGPRFTFTVPESARLLPTDPATITLKSITVAEEMRALKSAEVAGNIAAYELIKASIIEVDGKPLTWDGGAKDIFVEGLSPKVRQLIIKGHTKLHGTSDKEDDDFLGSMIAVI